MNIRRKMNVLKIILGVVSLLLVAMALSSFFALNNLKQAKLKSLKQNLYSFERSLEDVRTCLDAEVFDLAQMRLQEAHQVWKESQKIAKHSPAVQHAFEAVRKKYCQIWNDPEWNYRYKANGYPALQKEFEKICE